MKAALMMVTISALVLGGCTIVGESSAFRSDGLPKQQYYVGTALYFEYQPPCDGQIFVVEEISRKSILTQPVKKDDSFSFSFGDAGEDDIKMLESVGIDLSNMKFGYYFVPADATEVSEE